MRKRASRTVDHQSLANFRYEIRRFLNFSERAARAAGIEPQQHQALLAIAARPPEFETTVGVLAERLQVRHHTAVELSHRLAAKGWILRSRSRNDLRRVDLRLTRRGEHLLQKLSVAHRNELSAAGPRLIAALQAVLAHGGGAQTPTDASVAGAPRRNVTRIRRGSR